MTSPTSYGSKTLPSGLPAAILSTLTGRPLAVCSPLAALLSSCALLVRDRFAARRSRMGVVSTWRRQGGGGKVRYIITRKQATSFCK
jgi:hypothetical protein